MSTEPSPPPAEPEQTSPPPGGVRLDSGGDVNVGGDVAGRDVVHNVSTTRVGFGIREVQRLLVIVGALVFVTAACFFSGGVLVGGAAIAALNRPVASSPANGQAFEMKLNELRSLPPGQPFEFAFTENEISSYVKFIIGPQLGLQPDSGRVRLVAPGQVALGGNVEALGGLPVAGTLEINYEQPGEPLRLNGAMIQVLRLGDSPFGWVWVPPALLQPVIDSVNQLFGEVVFTGVTDISSPAGPAWVLSGSSR